MLEIGSVQCSGDRLMRTQVPSPCDTSSTYRVVKMEWARAAGASPARPRRKGVSIYFMVEERNEPLFG